MQDVKISPEMMTTIEKFAAFYQSKIDAGMSLAEAVAAFQRRLLSQAFKESPTVVGVCEKLNLKHPNVYQLIKRLRISKECMEHRDTNRTMFGM